MLPPSDASSNQDEDTCHDLSDIEISIHDVFQSLAKLDISKAMGIDGIPNFVQKFCSESLCSPIHYLFVQCFQQSYLPVEWRTHKIVPIFKSGDKSSVNNYQPISLMSCTSKVLERIIYNKIYDHISINISPNQSGFMKNRSTTQQLLKFVKTINDAFTNKGQMDVIYFDIKKAFDRVPHSILLTKFKKFGISLN